MPDNSITIAKYKGYNEAERHGHIRMATGIQQINQKKTMTTP